MLHRRSPSDPVRGRKWENASHRSSHCLFGSGAGRPFLPDHGADVYQQSGRRDERTGGKAHRQCHSSHVGRHVSRHLRPNSTPRGALDRIRSGLRHLRHLRSTYRDPGGCVQSDDLRRSAYPSIGPRPHQPRQESLRRSGGVPVERKRLFLRERGQNLSPVPADPPRAQCYGFRRPVGQRRGGISAALRRVGNVSRSVPAPVGGRISGHEPPAISAHKTVGRKTPQSVRGGRRRSIHLPVARRGHHQHPGL